MTANLRRLRSSWLPLVVLSGVTATVTAALVLVAWLTEGGGDPFVALPLMVVAPLVLVVAAMDVARDRVHEVALARLRGVHGVALVRVASGPALGAVLVGTCVAIMAAVVVGLLRPFGWPNADVLAQPPEWRLGWREWAWAAGSLVAASAVAVLASVAAARKLSVVAGSEPGDRRMSGHGVGRGAGAGAPMVVLLVAAAVVLYQAAQSAPEASPLVLAGPAVIGLAVGDVAVRARGLITPAARAIGGVGLLLGFRRALDRGAGGRLRASVASAVVAAAALSGAAAAQGWADQSMRLRSAADVQLALPEASALETLLLTRRLDPEGRWLMAAVVADDRTEVEQRVALVDLARYERVSGPALLRSPFDLSSDLDELGDATNVRPLTASSLTVSAEPSTVLRRAVVELRYLSDLGFVEVATTRLLPTPAGLRGTARVANCHNACVALDFKVTAAGRTQNATVRIDTLAFGPAPLIGADAPDSWVASPANPSSPDGPGSGAGSAGGGPGAIDAEQSDGLVARAGTTYVPRASLEPLPVLVAGDLTLSAGDPEVGLSIGATPKPVAPVGTRAALPLVVGAGVVGDLPAALAGARDPAPGARSLVLARADTPTAILRELRSAGADPSVTTESIGPSELLSETGVGDRCATGCRHRHCGAGRAGRPRGCWSSVAHLACRSSCTTSARRRQLRARSGTADRGGTCLRSWQLPRRPSGPG